MTRRGGSERRTGSGGTSGRRTGAGRPTPPAGTPTESELTSHRGIDWRKDPDGTIGWYNEDAGGWMRWRPGTDAPPLPPRWEADAARIPVPPRVRRPPWRSPYRLVPVLLVAAAVAYGAWQAGQQGGPGATRIARREAAALVGHCLARSTSPGASVVYGTSPVRCSSAAAAVRVVSVHQVSASSPRPQCGSGQLTLQLAYAGTRTPDIECALRVAHR